MNTEQARFNMIEQQIRTWDVLDPGVLELLAVVKREDFVPPAYRAMAFVDTEVPLPNGQSMLAPKVEARLLQELAVQRHERVLEVGAGSGYAAAVISRIADKVIGIERQHDLVDVATERLRRLGYDNVEIVEGDGTKGCRGEAPFDAILAAASGSHVPRPLVEQLAPNGRIVMPVGEPGWVQKLVKVSKQEDDILVQENLGEVRFVPLIGEEGWKDARY